MNWASEREGSVVIVAIVSYGRPEDVVACLSALARSRLAAFETVIVENGGAAAFDRLRANCEIAWPRSSFDEPLPEPLVNPGLAGERAPRSFRFQLPGRRPVLILEARDNLGYAGGVNLAIRCLGKRQHWRGVWILNPDTEPEPEALGVVTEYAERGPYGLVGSRLVFAGKDRIQMRGGQWRRLIARGLSLGYGEPANAPVDAAAIEHHLEWISGAALYATREFVETVGAMDERYFLYCEDVDWALRRGQFRLGYAHDAIVRHAHGATIGSASNAHLRSNLSVYLTERNSLLLTRARFPALYPLVVVVTLVLTLDYLFRGDWRVFVAACRGWWAGVRGESGRPAGPL